MSVETFEGYLGQAYTSADPVLKEAASNATEYTNMFKAGQISKDEYQQAMADIAASVRINQRMTDMSNLETLNTAINGLINLASLVG
jgi:hypothetical protein